jgi:TRAP-type uncharacterized transport system substrate-binding protein
MRLALAILCVLATPAAAQSTVGVVTSMWAATDAKAGQDLASTLNTTGLRVIPMGGSGAIQNLRDILHLPGVDAAFVPSDALTYARAHNLIPPSDLAKIQYIAKLYDEEVHILAGPTITSVADLAGKRINADVDGSDSAMTCDIILSALGIQADVRHMQQAEAMIALRKGDIDAVWQLGAAPVPIIANAPPAGLHLVPLPVTQPLADTYLPATLTHDEYPALVGGDPVPTAAIGDVLAVFGWPDSNPRHASTARFVDALFDHIGELQRPPRHPAWKEVNLAATVPGWVRFDAAAAYVRGIVQRDLLRAMDAMPDLRGMPPAERLQLIIEVAKFREQHPDAR